MPGPGPKRYSLDSEVDSHSDVSDYEVSSSSSDEVESVYNKSVTVSVSDSEEHSNVGEEEDNETLSQRS